ncbi:receptor expression-enhancing protein 1-like isoform X2 [Lampetra fluviatilis]
MVSWMISRLIALVFGTLYPAYSSYKAVRTKNVREYVKWMMYWIVFAIFTAVETFTDLVLAWFPFYYELKIFFVIWLLSPYTKGSSTLYRKFVHPALSSREHEIDEYLTQAKERSYETVMSFGKRGLNLATSAAVTAAAKGQGALSERLRSFSMQDLTLIHPDEPSRRAGSTLDTIDDSDEPSVSLRSDVAEQLEVRTDQSDEEPVEAPPPRRTQSLKATKAKATRNEAQARSVKARCRKKAAPANYDTM